MSGVQSNQHSKSLCHQPEMAPGKGTKTSRNASCCALDGVNEQPLSIASSSPTLYSIGAVASIKPDTMLWLLDIGGHNP